MGSNIPKEENMNQVYMKRNVRIRTLSHCSLRLRQVILSAWISQNACVTKNLMFYLRKQGSALLTANCAESLAADNVYTDCCKISRYLLNDFSKMLDLRGRNGRFFMLLDNKSSN